MLEDFSGAQTFAGTPEQMKAWNAARRARIASKRRADTRLSLLSQASGVRSVNNADQARAVTMNGRDG